MKAHANDERDTSANNEPKMQIIISPSIAGQKES